MSDLVHYEAEPPEPGVGQQMPNGLARPCDRSGGTGTDDHERVTCPDCCAAGFGPEDEEPFARLDAEGGLPDFVREIAGLGGLPAALYPDDTIAFNRSARGVPMSRVDRELAERGEAVIATIGAIGERSTIKLYDPGPPVVLPTLFQQAGAAADAQIARSLASPAMARERSPVIWERLPSETPAQHVLCLYALLRTTYRTAALARSAYPTVESLAAAAYADPDTFGEALDRVASAGPADQVQRAMLRERIARACLGGAR